MENRTYYDILGVSQDATQDEITAAKNALAKQYHPDVNMKNGVDTTMQMQEILEAYRILSNPKKRAKYNRKIFHARPVMQTFDLHAMEEGSEDNDSFLTYWKAAGKLYELIQQSKEILRQKESTAQIAALSMQALKPILLLRDAGIPEHYWHPDIMNWLLFTWYKNQNLPVSYLLQLHDEYVKNQLPMMDKLKLQNKSLRYTHNIKRLLTHF